MSITQYINSVRTEMTRVSWPSRTEVLTYTALVIGISTGIALFTGLLDAGLLKVLRVIVQ